jgi:chromosome segregation ATPase
VILIGFCCGFLSGCDHSSAIGDLQQDQADHAFSLGKAWDEIKLLKAEAETFAAVDGVLAERSEKHRNALDRTTKKADCAYDNGSVLAAKLQKLEAEVAPLINDQPEAISRILDSLNELGANQRALAERYAKDQAELSAVLAQQDQAIESLAARKPEPLPAPVAKPSPPRVEIIPANTKIISVQPVRCPTGKCPRNR